VEDDLLNHAIAGKSQRQVFVQQVGSPEASAEDPWTIGLRSACMVVLLPSRAVLSLAMFSFQSWKATSGVHRDICRAFCCSFSLGQIGFDLSISLSD
jgi:hypothetical protein